MKRRNAILAIAFLLAFIVGVAALNGLWPSIILPVTVEEPIEILNYSPLSLDLLPGETENITISVRNHATFNYTVTFDFYLNDSVYQRNFIIFSDETHIVQPGDNSLITWLYVETDASPLLNATLRIDIRRIRTGEAPPPSQPDLLQENWDSLQNWQIDSRSTLVEIDPPGQLHTLGGFATHFMTFPSEFTIEFRLKIDSFGDGYASFQTYTSRAFRVLRIFADKIEVGSWNAGFEEFLVVTDNEWHLWKMIVDEDTHETAVYRDGDLLSTFTRAEIRYDLTQRICIGTGRGMTCESHWDYLDIYTGLSP
ncbi:MAG: hypothetical protein JSV51_04345 [Candidatus Bathyarchaeota archaeon]|nr:MAG: hypothetical protein JSV51_04345 [Candidatus Bathyarchaeota archaeon]